MIPVNHAQVTAIKAKIDSTQYNIVAMRGLPGSGKSHLSRVLAQEFDYPIVSADTLGIMVHGGRERYFTPGKAFLDKRRLAYTMVMQCVRACFVHSLWPVVIDSTHMDDTTCLRLYDLRQSIFWLTVKTPEKVRFARLRRRREGLDFWKDITARVKANEYRPRGGEHLCVGGS